MSFDEKRPLADEEHESLLASERVAPNKRTALWSAGWGLAAVGLCLLLVLAGCASARCRSLTPQANDRARRLCPCVTVPCTAALAPRHCHHAVQRPVSEHTRAR